MTSTESAGWWRKAVGFAARRHAGQLRKDGQTPYVAHPFRVALIVRHVFQVEDQVALAAALLHDVIEDTTTDFDELAEAFDAEVALTVADLTKDKRLAEAEREETYFQTIARSPRWRTRLLKLADTYDNLSDALESGLPTAKTLDKARRVLALVPQPGDDPSVESAAGALRALVAQL